jgi:hypothetical protein
MLTGLSHPKKSRPKKAPVNKPMKKNKARPNERHKQNMVPIVAYYDTVRRV